MFTQKKLLLSFFVLIFILNSCIVFNLNNEHITFNQIIKTKCNKYNLNYIILEKTDIKHSFSFLYDELIDRIDLHELIRTSGLHYTILTVSNRLTLVIGKIEQLCSLDEELNNKKIIVIGISKPYNADNIATYLKNLFDLNYGITSNKRKNEIYLNKFILIKNMCTNMNQIYFDDILKEIKRNYKVDYITEIKN